MAYYVAQGAQRHAADLHLGEEGEVLVPELAQLAADQADQLGGYRITNSPRRWATSASPTTDTWAGRGGSATAG